MPKPDQFDSFHADHIEPYSLRGLTTLESGLILPEEPSLRAIVGEVTITDCVDSSSSPWFCGPYGFLLSSLIVYKDAIPYRGQLGFFQVEEYL